MEGAFRLLGANAVLHGYHTQRDGEDGLRSDQFLPFPAAATPSTANPGTSHGSNTASPECEAAAGVGAGAGSAACWPDYWPAPVLGAALHDL